MSLPPATIPYQPNYQRVGLISNAGIRYEGYLHEIMPEANTVALRNVRMFGTEERQVAPGQKPVPPSEKVYGYIIFKGGDIKDLGVYDEEESPKDSLPPDPAVASIAPPPRSAPQSDQYSSRQPAPRQAQAQNYQQPSQDNYRGGQQRSTPQEYASRQQDLWGSRDRDAAPRQQQQDRRPAWPQSQPQAPSGRPNDTWDRPHPQVNAPGGMYDTWGTQQQQQQHQPRGRGAPFPGRGIAEQQQQWSGGRNAGFGAVMGGRVSAYPRATGIGGGIVPGGWDRGYQMQRAPGMGWQGRGPWGAPRGPRPGMGERMGMPRPTGRTGAADKLEPFDFEAMQQIDKEELKKEIEGEQSDAAPAYDPKSFFDNVSSETVEVKKPDENKGQSREERERQRKVDSDTFGNDAVSVLARQQAYRGRMGRGRGGFRAGGRGRF